MIVFKENIDNVVYDKSKDSFDLIVLKVYEV